MQTKAIRQPRCKLTPEQIDSIHRLNQVSKEIRQQYKGYVERFEKQATPSVPTGPGVMLGASAFSVLTLFKQHKTQGKGAIADCVRCKVSVETELLLEAGLNLGSKVKVTQVENGLLLTLGDITDTITVSKSRKKDSAIPRVVICGRNLGPLRFESSVLVVYGSKGVFITKATTCPSVFGLDPSKPLRRLGYTWEGQKPLPMFLFVNQNCKSGNCFYNIGGEWLRKSGLQPGSRCSLERRADGVFVVKETDKRRIVSFNSSMSRMQIGMAALGQFPELIGKQLFAHLENGEIVVTAVDMDDHEKIYANLAPPMLCT